MEITIMGYIGYRIGVYGDLIAIYASDILST